MRTPAALRITGWFRWLDQFWRCVGSRIKRVPTNCESWSSLMR